MTNEQKTEINELIAEWSEGYDLKDSVLADPMLEAFELGLDLGGDQNKIRILESKIETLETQIVMYKDHRYLMYALMTNHGELYTPDKMRLHVHSAKIKFLEKFVNFLKREGYLDEDITSEEPYGIDEFMKEEEK